jgi:MoaA/NifB/PqqE/SkfB family radical SAM enzyme
MGIISQGMELVPKVAQYKLSRAGVIRPPMPDNLTFSITNMCQSRCKTCNIWKLYLENPGLRERELKIEEIRKIFKSIGHVYFFNISGGEPFLRQDLPEIVDAACKYLKPKVIHTPTNAIATDLVLRQTRKILEIMKKNKCRVPFTIKPSFDGVGENHDRIRGVKGNFLAFLKTYQGLKDLQKEYPNLEVGIGTVISNFNHEKIKEIYAYGKSLKPDSYINEIAEQRSELFTKGSPITPDHVQYKKAIDFFSKEIKKDLKKNKPLARITQAFRIVYYDLVVQTLKKKRQIIPCYGGIASVHINAYGDVWPCCILGYEKSMGNLREANYNFKKIWYSRRADKVRRYIKKGKCYCPLANISYTNILCNPKYLMKVAKNAFF